MSKQGYRSSLVGITPTKVDYEAVKRDGWNNDGLLVVQADDNRLSWIEREFIAQIGTKLYGSNNKPTNTGASK